MPLTMLEPNLRVSANVGKAERFMDAYAARIG
jgi:hypothetical protein